MNKKKYFITIVFVVLLVPLYILFSLVVDKYTNPTVVFLENKFHKPGRIFIIEVFKEIPNVTADKKALVLAADVAGNDTVLPLKKGYSLIAVDSGQIYYDLIIPEKEKHKEKIKIVSEINFDNISNLDLVMASFVLPFYSSKNFTDLWRDIDNNLNIGGYFIGNFFDPAFNTFENHEKMTFHTKQQVVDLFHNYEILKIEEVKTKSLKRNCVEYYYEVFAKKVR